ncbi:hypothetical protein ABZ725_21815 [Streptomyces sp. NPDC006872]|uniref:hypothetical protein n=1 Tax=Streptomyces sp. NPDC006872 TaxID=3155720 RepID=UPI0033D747EB
MKVARRASRRASRRVLRPALPRALRPALPRALRRSLRRAVLLCVPALCTLVSCGIPTTGVVEAGGPAHGIAPTLRIYFVHDGALIAVPRTTDAVVDVRPAVLSLLVGPTEAERAAGLTTLLPPMKLAPTPVPTRDPSTPFDAVGSEESAAEAKAEAAQSLTVAVSVNAQNGDVSIRLPYDSRELDDLAMAQLICTAVEARRTLDAGAETVTVTVTDARGRSVEGSDERCPGS